MSAAPGTGAATVRAPHADTNTGPSATRKPMAACAVAAAAGLALLAALGACGAGNTVGSASAAAAKTSLDPAAAAAQDAAFATAMFDNRHRGLQLVGLVAQYGKSSDVVAFAGGLQTSYDTQMSDLAQLLDTWGKPVPHVEAHSDLGKEIPGLVNAPALAELRSMAPAQFEKRFLTILQAHEKRAASLASTEMALGADPQATAYARDVLGQTTDHLTTIAELLRSRS